MILYDLRALPDIYHSQIWRLKCVCRIFLLLRFSMIEHLFEFWYQILINFMPSNNIFILGCIIRHTLTIGRTCASYERFLSIYVHFHADVARIGIVLRLILENVRSFVCIPTEPTNWTSDFWLATRQNPPRTTKGKTWKRYTNLQNDIYKNLHRR